MTGPTDDETPSLAGNDPKPDLRVSTHEDLGVEITRDLTGNGRLARGDRSFMSRLSFSARGKPRDEPDPELQALKNTGPKDVTPPTPPAKP